MPKSREEIDAEKAARPRVDKIPGSALNAIGDVQAYGTCKHGDCTWTEPGTEQADPQTHVASAGRHMADVFTDLWSVDPATGLLNLAHLGAQICITLDCMRRSDPERFDAIRATLPATLQRLRAELEAEKAPSLTVGSAFAAGAIEGEDPWKLPDGFAWHMNEDGSWSTCGNRIVDWYDSDESLEAWVTSLTSFETLIEVREIVKRRNGRT